MQELILETAIKTFTQELIKESFNWFGKATDEVKQFYNKGLKEYLQKQKGKYAHIKTLLQGSTPVYLYDIYFPIHLVKNGKKVKTDKISNLFADTNYITIVGGAGSGKSTLIKHLFLNSITEKYGIPILIELRYLNEYEGDIEDYIIEKIFENELSQNSNILERLLDRGKFIFFLDGFDEIAGEVKDNIIKQISSFINKYDKNKFILTSRPYANIEFLPLFHNCFIQSLNKEEVKKFVQLQLKSQPELAAKIIESIEGNPKKYIGSFLSNPLLLSLYILTFQSNSDIPNKKYIFYRRVVQALFSEHDSKSKLGYIRERKSKLSQESFEYVLKRFSFLSFFDKKFNFDLDYVLSKLKEIKSRLPDEKFNSQMLIKDLKLAVALWVEDGNKLKFAHKSLQEYFAALFIKELKEEQKKVVYSKISEGLKSMNEIDNFLSLCEEMDELDFFKSFLIPAIDKGVDNLKTGSDNEIISRIVTQTYSYIGGTESGYPYHGWSYYPLKKVSEINAQIKPLYDFLSKRMDLIPFTNKVELEGWSEHYEWTQMSHYEERVWFLNLTKPLQQPIIDFLKAEGIIDVIEKTCQQLNILKVAKREFVEKAEKANDDLINMI